MDIRYLSPRPENRSSMVKLFMKLWDAPLTEAQQEKLKNLVPYAQKRSEAGNLNVEGTPFPSVSCLLPRFHPDFEASIEPGVKDLMAAVAVDLDMVTYTSCEGHRYADREYTHDERHVGVIPRNEQERQRTLKLFEEVAREVNSRFPNSAIDVAIMDHTVRDGDTVYPAIDLYLATRPGRSVNEYFAELEELSSALSNALMARVNQRAQ
jgi:hypothetical protein